MKLIELDIDEKYVPNVFLDATMVSDRQIFRDTKQIVVPPVRNFLEVSATADKELYQPRDKGTFTITATKSGSSGAYKSSMQIIALNVAFKTFTPADKDENTDDDWPC